MENLLARMIDDHQRWISVITKRPGHRTGGVVLLYPLKWEFEVLDDVRDYVAVGTKLGFFLILIKTKRIDVLYIVFFSLTNCREWYNYFSDATARHESDKE